ncbi:unnamed protein product [Lasius platythorax]|uniref:Uncharacterized protein n=1 Tax=Lasius platythorax TaxID=488582 RepID=A0AAV2NL28_9HYME
MSEEISVKSIGKLNGKNFQCWKFQVTAALQAYGNYDVVIGRKIKLADLATVEGKNWVREDAKAKFILSSSIEEKLMSCLITCETSHEMWIKLSAIHEQKSASNKLILTQKFHEYRMSPSDSVMQHVAKVQNMAAQLADLGERISDVAIMAKILASLPSKYNPLKTAWDSVAVAEQTISNLQERLLKEEARLAYDDETANALAALSVQKKHKGKHSLQGSTQRGQPKDKSEVECYFCHKKGHFARDCRQKKRNVSQKFEKSAQSVQNCAFVSTLNKHCDEVQPSIPASQMKALLSLDSSEVWLMDSGASRHITYRREWLENYEPVIGEEIRLGDNGVCSVRGTGTVRIQKLVDSKWYPSVTEDVLFVPDIRKNLFSVGVCTSKGFNVTFRGQSVSISKEDAVVAQGMRQENGVFRMFFKTSEVNCAVNEVNLSTASLRVWHERLGHVNNNTVRDMVNKGVVKGMKLRNAQDFFCQACQMGKLHRSSFDSTEEKKKRLPGDFIHSDVCGPMSVESIRGAKFFLTFIDDASGYRQVYFLRHKSDAVEYFKQYECLVHNQFGRKMKVLRTDNGTEYCNRDMKRLLANKGIRHETTAPGTPEQNGKAERENRTIVESARTMLEAKSLPKVLWAEAVNTAVYILNRTSSTSNTLATPYEVWHGNVVPVVRHEVYRDRCRIRTEFGLRPEKRHLFT